MRLFELLKLFKLFALRTTRYTLHAIFLLTFLTFFTFGIGSAYAAPQMADYCYLPPFVTDPNTPPNIMLVYEKGSDIKKRAYYDMDRNSVPDPYNSAGTYYGFFDSSLKYTYNSTKGWFEKSACTASAPPATSNANCFSGKLLNWALMSSLDISRKTLTGFAWPKPSGGTAGEVFTYSGCFRDGGTAATCGACADTSNPPANCQAPVSKGQIDAGGPFIDPPDIPGVTVTLGGADWTYGFRLSQATGANPTGVTVRIKMGSTSPGMTGQCKASANCYEVISSGFVVMKFADGEDRRGIIQEYADKDKDYIYDSDAPRFGIRRWQTGTAADGKDRNADILCDAAGAATTCSSNSGNCTSTNKTELLKNLLGAMSKEPPSDPDTPILENMMDDIIKYFKGNDATYDDKDDVYTQTAYCWTSDPAKKCRKTFTVFVTTGANLDDGNAANKLSSSSCTSLDATLKTDFAYNACYGFNEDLSTEDGKQNIRTYVVHTSFYGAGAANEDKLYYASKTVGGGEYISVADPATLKSKLEEAILNILSTSASASTVATLTTQTRESSTLTQAYFYPKREGTPLRWVGYLRLLWSDTGANLREDTMNKGWLDLKKDKILSFYYDPGIDDPGIISYRARIYNPKISPADPANYLKIDSCSASTTTKKNEQVEAIWNAQTKLVDRTPDENAADKRNIKVGIDTNNSGLIYYPEVYNFTTALASTLQPYWSYASYCSNNTTRWCNATGDCNYCSDSSKVSSDSDNVALKNRSCTTSTITADCSYCDSKAEKKCTDSSSAGGCYLPDNGTCSGFCSTTTTQACTSDSECPSGEVCGKAGNICTGNSAACDTCAAGSGDICCTVNYGPCVTSNLVCNTGVSCSVECDSANCATSVIKFIRGYDRPNPAGLDFRLRQTDETSTDITSTLKLGDIVYSTPRISPNSAVNGYDVTYKDDTYKNFVGSDTIKNATPIVIVGANDGMVHAFKVGKIKDVDNHTEESADGYQTGRFSDYPPIDAGVPSDIGKELWAYIPWNAVPYLKWYCSESYCHIPMADARFTVIDASIDYDKNGSVGRGVTETRSATDVKCDGSSTCPPYPWRRLLIGAMGDGGKKITVSRTFSSSIFVLDITDPTSPRVLWERRMPDDTLTTSTPAVVRLASAATEASKNENGKWYLVIGSGPESVTTNKLNYKSGNARIFVFDLITGDEAVSGGLDIGASGVAVGDMMAVDFDSDYQVDDIYFGTYGGTGATQTGNLYRLRIRNGANYQTTPSSWDIETVVDVGRPIYAGAEIAQDALGNKWLYFGTGLYLTLEHATATSDNEWLYAVKETNDCWKGGGSCSTYSNFLDTSGISFTGATAVEVGCFCAGSLMNTVTPGTLCGPSEDTVVLKVTDATLTGSGIPTSPNNCTGGLKDKAAIDCLTTDIVSSYDGWKRAITGQKSFSKPFVAGGLVDFTTFQPKSTVCSLGGDTYLYSLHYTTGTAYVQPTILACDKVTGCSTDISDLTINASVNLGTGVPPLGESLVALPLSGDTYKVITQVSGGLPGTSMAPSLPAKSGYVLWLVK